MSSGIPDEFLKGPPCFRKPPAPLLATFKTPQTSLEHIFLHWNKNNCKYDMKRFSLLALPAIFILFACKGNDPEPVPQPTPAPSESGFVYSIDPDTQLGHISPFIYGTNVQKGISHKEADVSTMVRLGGNRLTGYNWENNASNAGKDWYHHSDNHLVSSVVEGSRQNEPGSVAATFVKNCLDHAQMPMVTVPICYSVAADMNGTVEEGDASRWVDNKPRKGSPFASTPDLSDGVVHADEMIHFLADVKGYGGKVIYSLDNEPDLWHSTHPRICPKHISCEDLIQRTVDFASAIKDTDPKAKVLGYASFGYTGFTTFNSAPDWDQLKSKGGYSWFIDAYLDQVARAGKKAGHTLVDVLDIHWYPAAKGDNQVNQASSNSLKDKAARLQAPRSLWDDTYKENSWITGLSSYRLPLIPELQKSIDKYAPGTGISISEFNYGGYEDVTGAIALCEVLGIFGKYGVWSSNHWGDPGTYGWLAYNLYRNYDGAGSAYGDTLIESSLNKTWVNSSVFASSDSSGNIHVIVTNKQFDGSIEGKFKIAGSAGYKKAEVYWITDEMPSIQGPGTIPVDANQFKYKIPPLSVAHIVIRK